MTDQQQKKRIRVGAILIELKPQIDGMDPDSRNRTQLFGDVAVAVLEQIDRLKLETADRLIRRIARNRRVDLIRRATFRNHRSLEALPGFDPAEPTAGRGSTLDDLIAHLPDTDQAMLRAHFRDGKTWAEIAAEQNCSEGTVRSRWHRLKQQLAHDDVLQTAASPC